MFRMLFRLFTRRRSILSRRERLMLAGSAPECFGCTSAKPNGESGFDFLLAARFGPTILPIMTDDEDEDITFILSPLSQRIERDGKSVDVDIYQAEGDTVWILEVVDREGASTVFDEPFYSDQDALDAVLLLIEQEGIDTFLEDHSGTIH